MVEMLSRVVGSVLSQLGLEYARRLLDWAWSCAYDAIFYAPDPNMSFTKFFPEVAR